MALKDSLLIGVVFLGLVFLSIWLQFGLLAQSNDAITKTQKNVSDYYIEKFTATGTDQTGTKYQIIANRMEHYPLDDRASLDNPHIIQYDLTEDDSATAVKRIYAQSGWLYNNQSTVLLSGNVRIIQNKGGGAETTVVNKMRIHLKK